MSEEEKTLIFAKHYIKDDEDVFKFSKKDLQVLLNLIEKQQKVANLQEKTIQLMAEELKEITGSCPLDIFDYDLDCENKCEQEMDAKCWAEYFRNKAKESE